MEETSLALKMQFIDSKESRGSDMKPAALLLSTASIQCLKDELDLMYELGPHFDALFGAIFVHLEDDPHCEDLRKTTLKCSVPLFEASKKVLEAFAVACNFYLHDDEELDNDGCHEVTEDKTRRLLGANFQLAQFEYVQRAKRLVAEAAKIIRLDVLPVMAPVERAVDQYIREYLARLAAHEERQNSWLPSALQDAIWGKVDPTPVEPTRVKNLSYHLAEGMRILNSLLPFLDRLELFFRRLSELNTEQIYELGYTSSRDIKRLYQDRLLCYAITSAMMGSWVTANGAFCLGSGLVYNPYHR